MEEKLREILEHHIFELIQFEEEKNEMAIKCMILKEHGFLKEYEWLKHERQSKESLFFKYQEIVNELRDLLNAWES